jgi:hypothetical protein
LFIEGDSEYIGGDNDESMQQIREHDEEMNNSMDNPRRSTMKKHRTLEDDEFDEDDNLLKPTLSKNNSGVHYNKML